MISRASDKAEGIMTLAPDTPGKMAAYGAGKIWHCTEDLSGDNVIKTFFLHLHYEQIS